MAEDILELLHRAYPDDEWSLSGDDLANVVFHNRETPSVEEMQAAIDALPGSVEEPVILHEILSVLQGILVEAPVSRQTELLLTVHNLMDATQSPDEKLEPMVPPEFDPGMEEPPADPPPA